MTAREIYVFGSITSGAIDAFSDIDVLVIADDSVERAALPRSCMVASTSRIRELYERGTLFAWHLHRDAVRVWPRPSGGLLAELGAPRPYRGARAETGALFSIARDAVTELMKPSPSPLYELGLLYVASRDIAMAAAPSTLGDFCFSRNAPFQYERPLFPLTPGQYEYLMRCRRGGTRGTTVARDDRLIETIVDRADKLLSWLGQLTAQVANEHVPVED